MHLTPEIMQAIISIQKVSSDTSAADFSSLLKENVTFAETLGRDSDFHLLSRSRLRRIRETLVQCMDEAFEPADDEDTLGSAELELAN